MKIFNLVVFFMLIGSVVVAQPGLPPPDPGPVPIHGIGYLLAAGAVLGIKKIIDTKRRKN
jgi:hypothetical protein